MSSKFRAGRAKENIIAVTRQAETALNTPGDPDTSLLVGLSDVMGVESQTETDAEDLNAREEQSRIFFLLNSATGTFNFARTQPHHLDFLCGYGMGAGTQSALGDGYKKIYTPIAGDYAADRSNPSFTCAMKYSDVFKRLFSSCFMDSFTVTFNRNEWVKSSGTIKGTGKTEDNVVVEDVTAMDDATELTLAANGVQGADADARMKSVHEIMAEVETGKWVPVAFSAVSDATPAVITITGPGATTTSITYRVLYVPTESAAWMTFPPMITESGLRISDVTLNFGGTWNGTTFEGGRNAGALAKSVEWTFSNNLTLESGFDSPGSYANECFREGRTQTLKFDRFMKDYVLENLVGKEDYFGMKITATGASFTGGNYGFEIVFPKCGVLKAPISADGKRLMQAGEIAVLEGDYPSAIATVTNLTEIFG